MPWWFLGPLTIFWWLGDPSHFIIAVLVVTCLLLTAATRRRRRSKGTTVLEMKVHIDNDVFEFKGDATISDVAPLLNQWYTARTGDGMTQGQIDALTARINASRAKLAAAVDSAS